MLELNKSTEQSKNKVKAIVMGLSLLVLLGVLSFLVWDSDLFSSDTQVKQDSKELSHQTKNVNKEVEKLAAKQKNNPISNPPPVTDTNVQKEETPHYMQSSTQTKTMTELMGNLEVKKLQFSLLELEKKMQELDSPAPSVVTPNMPSVMVTSPPSMQPKILSIEGLDGKLKAILKTSSGMKTVKVGDLIESGRIEKITDSAVYVATKNGTINLSFYED